MASYGMPDYGMGGDFGGMPAGGADASPARTSYPDPEKMSVKELKAELANLKVDFSDCYEKTELQMKLKQVQEKMKNLLTIDARTTADATAVVIFLHGLGDSGHGWLGPMHAVAQRLPHVKFVLPNAPMLPVALNQGQPMPAWYDCFGLNAEAQEDSEGINISEKFIRDIMKDELSDKLPASRVVLGGFSQGGAAALNAALKYPEKVGGCFVLSGWAPNRSALSSAVTATNKSLPVFWAHGTADTVVAPSWGKASFDDLSKVVDSSKCVWKEYDGMAHQSNGDEINDLAEWLRSIVP